MMHMTFYWGKDVVILFDFWRVKTWTWYAASLVAVFLVAMLHEWLASQRAALRSGGKPDHGDSQALAVAEEEANHRTPLIAAHAYADQKSSSKKAMEALLFAINVGLGYLLMLAAMSFNGGVFLAIVTGLGVGHFLFNSPSSDGASACGAM